MMRDFSILSAVVYDLNDIQICTDTVTTVSDCIICLTDGHKQTGKIKTEVQSLQHPLSMLLFFPVRN